VQHNDVPVARTKELPIPPGFPANSDVSVAADIETMNVDAVIRIPPRHGAEPTRGDMNFMAPGSQALR
jgi:hypothetical protein